MFDSTFNLVAHVERLSKWRQHIVKNGKPFFVKKLKILYSLDHTISFEFHQHVVQILTK